MLRRFRYFVKIYINDIIAHSYILNEHLNHLKQLFQLFKEKRVSLSLSKSFLKYFFVILLDQRVDCLSLSTFAEKMIVISSLQFFKSLSDLKFFLKFTE